MNIKSSYGITDIVSKHLDKHAQTISDLRKRPISASVTEEYAREQAKKAAKQSGFPIAVGFGFGNEDGEREWTWCPITSMGPAFVLDPLSVYEHKLIPLEMVILDAKNPTDTVHKPLDDAYRDVLGFRTPTLDASDIATLLAALRFWQRRVIRTNDGLIPSEEAAYFTDGSREGVQPLDDYGIEDLCTRICLNDRC